MPQIFVQITFVLMQRINLLLKLCPDDVIRGDIVPMITRALDSRWEQLQELCLTALPSIAALIEGPVMKNTILPRVMKLCVRSKENNASLGLRVNCLLCLAKMIENFDRWLVFDQIIPFLQQVPSNNEPAMIMAVIGNTFVIQIVKNRNPSELTIIVSPSLFRYL